MYSDNPNVIVPESEPKKGDVHFVDEKAVVDSRDCCAYEFKLCMKF